MIFACTQRKKLATGNKLIRDNKYIFYYLFYYKRGGIATISLSCVAYLPTGGHPYTTTNISA
ncbi:MAG: hypothetical protein BGP13_16225 [Sphingobacteriales bacterium 40-81]|nr:MAG: hypothetical protein BGP13_16225 [Sphingobacteriales bacterium 40-81]